MTTHLRSLCALTVSLCFVFSGHASAAILGNWKFDQDPRASGDPIVDSARPIVHDGDLFTNNGAANKSVAGIVGRALNFDNNGDRVVANLGGDLVLGNSPRTVSTWINPDVIDGSQSWIYSYGNNSAGEHFGLSLENSGGSKLRFRHFGGFVEYDAAPITTGGGWYHVAQVVPNGATTVGDVKVYLNGSELTDKSGTTGTALNTTPNGNLTIGALFTNGSVWDGQIDEVQFYDRALSSGQVASLAATPGSIVGSTPDSLVETTLTPSVITTAARNGASPDTDGFGTTLAVRERNGDPNNQPADQYRAFLEFDLSGLSPDDIVDAQLVLTRDATVNTSNDASVFAGQVLDDWDTGANPPTYGQSTSELTSPLGAVLQVADTYRIDVTDIVSDWHEGIDPNYGFRIRMANAFQGISFFDTGTFGPQLIITQRTPEPASIALALFGLIFLGSTYRRRIAGRKSSSTLVIGHRQAAEAETSLTRYANMNS